jgi:nucleoside-diphosphate-sugar epimerase
VDVLNDVIGTSIAPEHGPPRTGDVKESLADIGLAREILGYRPTVNFREGIERTVAWIAERHHV